MAKPELLSQPRKPASRVAELDRERGRRGMSATTSAILRNVYRSPFEVELQRRAPDICFLFGEIRITDLEISDLERDEGGFVSLITARLESAVDGMVEVLRTSTFPVHDPPWEDAA